MHAPFTSQVISHALYFEESPNPSSWIWNHLQFPTEWCGQSEVRMRSFLQCMACPDSLSLWQLETVHYSTLTAHNSCNLCTMHAYYDAASHVHPHSTCISHRSSQLPLAHHMKLLSKLTTSWMWIWNRIGDCKYSILQVVHLTTSCVSVVGGGGTPHHLVCQW